MRCETDKANPQAEQCTERAEFRTIYGCVHEHVDIDLSCRQCRDDLEDGKLACDDCKMTGHECNVVLILAVPLPVEHRPLDGAPQT